MENKKTSATKKKVIRTIKKVMGVLGTLLCSLVLVVIITGSVFVTAITVYVMNFAEATDDYVSLEEIELTYTSQILAPNPLYDGTNDPWQVYYTMSSAGDKMVWTDFEDVSRYVIDAFVCSEDERFYDHDGVDFKRTFGAFVNIFIPIYGNMQGGSTITQQTIKVITGDDARDGVEGVSRKIREILRSINTENTYGKDDILEAYLNVIYLGRAEGCNYYGVQSASNFYFGKDVKDLTLAQAATIAAINKDPTYYNPYRNPENNKGRATYILDKMYENGAVSSDEYYQALADLETIQIVGDTKYSSDGEQLASQSAVSSYYVDATINQAIEELMQIYGIDYESASSRLYSGGYKIYTNVDLDMQSRLEQEYLDDSNFQSYEFKDDELLSSFICMDYDGRVLAVIGNRGEKTSSRVWNNATMATRSPGSTIKPLSVFAPAIEQDMVTWSTLLKDEPIDLAAAGSTEPNLFPNNYSEYGDDDPHWTHKNMTVEKMLETSTNTGAAQIVRMLTPTYCFNFLQGNLGFTSLVQRDDSGRSDVAYSPMTVGSLTKGMYLSELVSAYQIFGNGGTFHGHSFISKIADKDDKIVYEFDPYAVKAIGSDTAYVMNRMMLQVVEGKDGTGKAANLDTVEVIAKTGTSENWENLTFVACTPEYVSGIWVGYENPEAIDTSKYQSIPKIWKNVFGEIADEGQVKTFKGDSNVSHLKYCTKTGCIATADCKSTAMGYFKNSNTPDTCKEGLVIDDDAVQQPGVEDNSDIYGN